MSLSKFSLFVLLFYSTYLHSQVKISETDQSYALELKKKYKEASTIIKSSNILFEFKPGRSGKPVGIQKVSNEYLSLRLNHKLDLVHFYDNYSKINSFSSRNHKNKVAYVQPVCGDWKVDDIFYHDMKFCGYGFNFQSIGEKRKFEIEKEYFDIKYLTKYMFAERFPVLERTVTIVIPAWLNLEIKEFNFEPFPIQKKTAKLANGNTQVTYHISDLEAIKQVAYSRGPSFTHPHILFMPKTYSVNGTRNNIVNSIDDLYAWYHSLTNSEEDSQYIKSFTNNLVKECTSTDEKIKTIFYWLQDNIRYIAFEDGLAGFAPEKAETVLKKKYGDCKGMANLLKAMLQNIGIDARLTWLGTNSILYDYSTPTLSSDNHVICTILKGDKKIFLDATEKYGSINSIGERIQGRQVLIEDGKNYIFDSIPKLDCLHNEFKKEIELEVIENKLIGNATLTINGERKTMLLNLYNSTKVDKREEMLKYVISGNNQESIRELSLFNEQNRDSSLIVNADLSIENEVSAFNDEYYVSLNFLDNSKTFIIDEERLSDVYFEEKVCTKTETIIKIPSGMKVKYLPTPMSIENPFFNCKIGYKEVNQKIICSKTVMIPQGYIPIEMKNAWNDFQKKMKNHRKEQLVLEKI